MKIEVDLDMVGLLRLSEELIQPVLYRRSPDQKKEMNSETGTRPVMGERTLAYCLHIHCGLCSADSIGGGRLRYPDSTTPKDVVGFLGGG